MNILLYDVSGINAGLIDHLTGVKDISLYLSVSMEDTLRILTEVNPQAIILGKDNCGKYHFIQMLGNRFPDLAIFLYEGKETSESPICVLDYRCSQALSIDSAILKVNSTAPVDKQINKHK